MNEDTTLYIRSKLFVFLGGKKNIIDFDEEILLMLRLQLLECRIFYILETTINGKTSDNRLVKYFVRR